MFDINPRLIGLVVRGIEIRSVDDLEQFVRDNDVQIAALTIPKTKAPEIADRLVSAGIKAIWNFAHTDRSFWHCSSRRFISGILPRW